MAVAPPGSAPRAGPPPKVATTKQSPVWSPNGSSPPAGKRNGALIGIGVALILVALGFGSLFTLNLYQYTTVEQRWASEPAGAGKSLGVKIIKAAALRRMIVFGPAAAVAGVPGFILLVLGLRRR
jgi:hypothetical protein